MKHASSIHAYKKKEEKKER